MKYTPTVPAHLGLTLQFDIPLRGIVPFIQWKFFFMAWRLSGNYEGIQAVCDCASCKATWLQNFPANEREKASEALKLFRDAQEVLRDFLEKKSIRINTATAFYQAYSKNDDIIILQNGKEIVIPTLRQQHASTDGFCYSLADFLAPENDYIGLFAATVLGVEELAKKYEENDDMYHAILVKTLGDRLAEASAEWLHYQVRTKYWGYNPNEKLNISAFLKSDYPGIRPAVGYPSLPDQSIIFEIEPLLEFDKIGIKLTENGAMSPNSSVCGLYFAHPQSKYFQIGKIDEKQLADYANRRNKSKEEMKRWLASNV